MSKLKERPSKEELQSSYNELRSITKVADKYGVSDGYIYNCMKGYGIERMSISEAKLPKGIKKPPKEELEKMYDELRSTYKVGEKYGVGSGTVNRWMKQDGIERMSISEAKLPKGIKKPPKEELEKMYDELRSTTKVAKYYKVSPGTIRNWMEKDGIERMSISEAMLPKDFKKPTKEELEKAYEELGNTRKVAEKYGVSQSTIWELMKQYEIERNGHSDINDGELESLLVSYAGGQND